MVKSLMKLRAIKPLWFCAFLCLPQTVLADEEANIQSWMFGVGAGVSYLQPKISSTSYEYDKQDDVGYRLNVGYTIAENWTAEITYADLGKVTLDGSRDPGTPSIASLSYQFFGLNGFWYPGRGNGYNIGNRWNWLLEAGIGQIENQAEAPLTYVRKNDVSFDLGFGVEYEWSDRYTTRILLESFDRDAALLSANLLFAPTRHYRMSDEVESEPVQPAPIPVVPPVVMVEPVDSDGDGVVDEDDCCPNTPSRFGVNSRGCPIFKQRWDNIQFKYRSYDVQQSSEQILNDIATALSVYPRMLLEIGAHTDNKGSDKYNLILSQKRAESVKKYLESRGVSTSQLVARGYGETSPVAPNSTEEGMALNRRVELKALKSGLNSQGCPVNGDADKSSVYPDYFDKSIDVVVSEANYFNYRSANLSQTGKFLLMPVVKLIKQMPSQEFYVDAFSDGVASSTYNLKLSSKRAENAKKFLVEQGVSAVRLYPRGRGEVEPLSANDSLEGRRANRRVEVNMKN